MNRMDKKNKIKEKKELVEIMLSFSKKIQYDHVSSFAGHAALFLLMSIFPMVMYFISVFQYIPIDTGSFIQYIYDVVPDSITPLLDQIASEATSVNRSGSGIMQYATMLVTLVCASKGVYAIIIGMNAVYGIRETRNFVVLYALAVIYVVVFFGILGSMMLLIVCGNIIYGSLMKFIPGLGNFQNLFSYGKYLGMLFILNILFLLLYMNAPNRKSKVRYEFPGAFFSTIVSLIFSWAFSYYIDHVANYSVTYGSLATIIIFILWLYGIMNIVFIGAEINVVLRKFAEYDYNYKRAYDYYKDEYEGDLINKKGMLIKLRKKKKGENAL